MTATLDRELALCHSERQQGQRHICRGGGSYATDWINRFLLLREVRSLFGLIDQAIREGHLSGEGQVKEGTLRWW
jgi:hypothetical protein